MVSEPIKYTNQCQQQLHEKKGSSEIKKNQKLFIILKMKLLKEKDFNNFLRSRLIENKLEKKL